MRTKGLVGSTILTAAMIAPGQPAIALPADLPVAAFASGAAGQSCPARAGWIAMDQADALARFAGRQYVRANWVGVDGAGALSWNGTPVERSRLDQYLEVVGMMQPRPALIINVTPGECARVDAVAAMAEAHGSCAHPGCIISVGPALPPLPAPPAPAPPAPRRP